MADENVQDPEVESRDGASQNGTAKDVNGASQADAKTDQVSESKTDEIVEGRNAKAQDNVEGKEAEKTTSDSRGNNRDTRGNNRHGDRNASNRGNFKKSKSQNKFDPSSAKETNDPVEIRKQVEFYFSDSNLPNDKFLFEAIGGSKNNPVPIKTIHSFKRMRRFQPFSAVVEALKESSTLEVVEDDTAIKRKVALPDGTDSTQPEVQKVFEDKIMSRSVYVKGFGSEEPSTQFDIEAWFSKYGDTNQVRLRRSDDSSFKGSVFVEFDSEETAKKFLSLEPAPKYNGNELVIKSKKQYCDEKVNDINSGAIRKREPDQRDWKARREQDRKDGFPSVHKDGRERRNDHRGGRGGRGGRGNRGGRGGGRDRGNRRRNDNDDERDNKVDDGTDDTAKESTGANDQNSKGASADTKKRDRDDEKDDDTPATKKSAVESDMTGGPEAVEKTSAE